MIKKLLLLNLTFIYFSITVFSQTKPLRIEIEPKSSSDEYYIAPAGTNGVLVFNETHDKGDHKGERIWTFTLYDVVFNEVWTKTASVPKGLEFVKFYNDQKNLYILLANTTSTSSTRGDYSAYYGNFTIINVDVISGNFNLANGKLPFNTSISDFKIINNNAFFGGKVLPTSGELIGKMCLLYCTCMIPVCFGGLEFKTPGTIVTMDLNNNKANYHPITYKGNSAITSIDVEKERVSLFVANRESKTLVHGFIHEYDKYGKEINKIKLDPKGNEINTGTISSFGENEKVVIGTYSLPISKNSFAMKMARAMAPTSGSSAQGVYIAKVANGEQQFIKYYSFTDFQNFFSYLPSKAEQRVERISRRKKEQGSDLRLNYQILVHQLTERNGQYFFVGECYYPEYHYETYYVNGKPQTRRVFDGWRYTHAIVATFDQDGNLLWDASFPIWNILTFNLKERVKVLPQNNNSTVLVYSYGGFLTSKVVSGNTINDFSQNTPIDTGNEGDRVKSDFSSDIIYWYDNYFIAWGYQKIKNKEREDVKKKRFVFYFNKIAFN